MTKRRKRQKRITGFLMALVLVCLFLVPQNPTSAKDNFISDFIQTVYNQENGIGSNEVNCLYQSSSGYVWIGTDGGLYRSNGSSFQSINLWDTDRTDVYSINSIMQDNQGRMWIGTDNYGLFYYIDGDNYHLQDEYYEGIKTIYDVCQTDDGTIYVAASNGLYTCVWNADGTVQLEPYIDESVAGTEFKELEVYDGEVWGITGGFSIYVLNDEGCQSVINTQEAASEEVISIKAFDNCVYVGTAGTTVIRFTSAKSYSALSTLVVGENSFTRDENGYVWVCADNGLGYFDNGDTFTLVNDCEIDNYLSDIIQDYEGNYWISSTRMGVVLLSRSKFTDYNIKSGLPEVMVNCVYTKGGYKYIGTDEGLYIFDENDNQIDSELTTNLNGVSIRNVLMDKKGVLWVSTYRRYGLVRMDKDGNITNIGKSAGLPSNALSDCIELSNGDIAVSSDTGIAILNESGELTKTYGREEGILNENILCLYEDEDGKIYAGSDGDGLYCIETDGKVKCYTTDDGINSNVVTEIKRGDAGLWIGTDNGLCFYNEAFRAISNIEYSNSIYDIICKNKMVWLIGSKGVLRATEEELLGNQGISERYYDKNDGLYRTLNTYSNTVMDNKGRLYICCNSGTFMLDTENIYHNEIPPRMKVTSIDIDGKLYEFDDLDDGIIIKSDSSRITIDFAVFSFANRANIEVSYYLDGFDEEPIIVYGDDSMEAVYTNLDGGVYRFVISAQNGDGTECAESVSFLIEKEKSLFENPVARFFFLFALCFGFGILVVAVFRVQKLLKTKNKALEKLSKEHEEAVKSSSAKNDYLANMSNEIKLPINSIMAKADELMKLGDISNENIDSIKEIYLTGNEILEKVDDIILLAKIEAGRIEEIKSPYSVTSMIYELSEEAVKKIEQKRVRFYVEIGEDIIDNIIGDVDKVKDVLARIIDNAVKFTKEGSITISVDCYEYADKGHQNMINVVYTVSDTGIGIQEDRIDSLFEVYNIADNKKNSPYSGNGVGLAIANGYASLMGGEIEVESVYGAGSTFTFSLNQRIADNLEKNRLAANKIQGTVSRETADKLWLPDVTALVVDDSEISREVTLNALAQFEMKIDVATSGISAIDMVMNNSYDVVFMDISMPVMNGTDAMMEIRELEGDKYSLIPIIAMDTDAIEESKNKLIGAGFTDSIVMPIDIRRVAAVLRDCLPGSKIREKTNDIAIYIEGSRFSDGLFRLKEYIDVENAIEKIGGSIDVFNKLINAYYNQNAKAAEELGDKWGKDIRGFKNKIHILKTTSLNIGAYKLAQEATKLEAAINIGNKDYIRDNISKFTEQLINILNVVAEYISFVEEMTGMTDEEYILKRAEMNNQTSDEEEEPAVAQMIDLALLEMVRESIEKNDIESANDAFEAIVSREYLGEDREFLNVLIESYAAEKWDEVIELILTYKDLRA